jgi:hypothetical protein
MLQKSFWGDERNFLGLLMRFVRSDVRVLIVSHKNDHGPSQRRYRASQWQSCLKICFREILVSFDFRLLQQNPPEADIPEGQFAPEPASLVHGLYCLESRNLTDSH